MPAGTYPFRPNNWVKLSLLLASRENAPLRDLHKHLARAHELALVFKVYAGLFICGRLETTPRGLSLRSSKPIQRHVVLFHDRNHSRQRNRVPLRIIFRIWLRNDMKVLF